MLSIWFDGGVSPFRQEHSEGRRRLARLGFGFEERYDKVCDLRYPMCTENVDSYYSYWMFCRPSPGRV